MPKLKIVRPILATRAAVETCVAETCEAQLKREKLIAKRDAKIAAITADYASEIEEHGEAIENNLTLLEQWADANAAEFGDARSVVIGGARLGFRTGNPAVKPVGKLTFKAIVAALQKLGGDLEKKYLKVKTDLDKEAALATARLLESTDEAVRAQAEAELEQVGVEIVQGETFYLDPPREGQPDATLTKSAA